MSFVSLSDAPRERVVEFVRRHAVPWPCGYAASLEDIAQLGAYSSQRMSASYNAGLEVSPTLCLVGPDGEVLWCDGQARPRHAKEPPEIVGGLEAAIRAALEAAPGKKARTG